MTILRCLFFLGLLSAGLRADPQLSSWVTTGSSKLAHIAETDAALVAGTSETTWSRSNGQTTLTQSLPVYAGPQQIDFSSSWIYLKSPDLAPYLMGPWYNDSTRTTLFVNIPVNQAFMFRLPRTTTLGAIPSTKTGTLGFAVNGVLQAATGFFVDGVAMFDPTDGFSYSNGSESSPGTGQWHRDAYMNEGPTFDKGLSHQQNTGVYHNHVNPYALRYLLGDNITFNSSTKVYAEGSTTAPPNHSPILAWSLDGLPIYGPYGYSNALDATSGVRRMVSGFVLRDGTTPGADNLNTAGRGTLPAWTLRNNGNVSAAGPNVSSTYPLGRYIEDNAYLGDLIKSGGTYYVLGTDFDLNEFNVRYCVTPEFPGGTYAYFLTVTAAGVPTFPYMTNRWYFGTPTGSTVTSVSETVTNYFKGGAALQEAGGTPTVQSGNVTFTWSAVEGGTYLVEASNDLAAWTTLSTGVTAATNSASLVEAAAATNNTRRFYRATRESLASFDSNGAPTSESTVETSSATGVGGTFATLNGLVNAGNSSSTVSFQYGVTTGYGGNVSAAQSPVTGTASTAVSAYLSGLSLNSTYHYRIVSSNTVGTIYGEDMTLTTTGVNAAAPTATTGAASSITSSTATVSGAVNANNATTTCSFDYGTTTAYGTNVAAFPASASGTGSTSVTGSLTGLAANTTYHFRVKGVNAYGTTLGSDATFTTSAAATQGISSVSPGSGTHGTNGVVLTITLNSSYSPSPPPNTVPPTAVTLTGPATVSATTFSRNTSTGVITATFNLPSITGSYTVNATFGPNTWSLTGGFTVN